MSEAVVEQEGAVTPAVETGNTVAVAEPAGMAPAASGNQPAAEDLAKVRELVLRAHPDVVPDLVQGASIDALIASVEPARTAYQRVAETVRGQSVTTGAPAATEASTTTAAMAVAQPPQVPAGGAANVVDPTTLAPTTKIARALEERGRGAGG